MKKTFFWICLGALGLASASNALAQDTQPVAQPAAQTPADPSVAAAPQNGPSQTPATPAPPAVNATEQAAIASPASSSTAAAAAEPSPTPATQTDAATEAAPPPPKKLFWRNSMFWADQSISSYTLAPSGQLTYDPTYSWNFRFMPRVYVLPKLFLRATMNLDVELTQSDITTTTRQPMFGDIWLDAISPGLVTFDHFVLTAGGRVTLPTSIMSQADNLYFGAGVLTNASYNFPDVASGLSLIFNANYIYNVRGSNARSVENGYGCMSLDNRPGRVCTQTGATNLQQSLVFGPAVSFNPTEKLQFFALYFFNLRVANAPTAATIETSSGPVAIADNSPTHQRNWQTVYFALAYDFLDYLNVSLYYTAVTDQFNPNGSWRNPLWNYDTSIGLTATLTLDQLYTVLTAEGPELTPEQLRRIRNGQAQNNRALRNGGF